MKEHKFFGKGKIWISLALACVLLTWQSAAADTDISSAQNADAFSANAVSTQTSDSMGDSETAEKAAASASRDAREAVLSMKKDTNKLRYDSQNDVFYEGEVKVSLRWIQYLGDNYYVNEDGHPYRSMFLTDPSSGDTYYFGPTGIMLKGISRIAGDYYYFTESGKDAGKLAKKVGWYTTSEGRVFAAPGGKLYHDQFITFGPQNKYYMGAKGVMQTGKVRAKGTVYDIAEDGRVKMGAHRYTADGKTYYAQENGEPYRSMFLTDPSSGDTYYFGPTGIMLKGISRIAGDYYYFTEGGKDAGKLAKKVGWYTTSEGRVFAAPGGKLYHDRFITFGPQNKYYMGAKGVMQTGKVRAKGTVYDIAEDGRVKMGAHRYTADGKTYYAQENGEPYRSMFLTDPSSGDTYYFEPTGIMLKGISCIAGDYYYFTESGKDAGKLVKKVGWYTTSEGRVFAAPGGKLYHDQFITFGPQNKYYMGAKGVMQTGKVRAKGTVYDIAEDGRVKMGAHRYTADGKTYYAQENGEPYRNIFLKYPDGRVMLMGEDGSQLTGISLYRGVAYRFDDEGYLVRRSSAYEYQGKTYFSKPDGKPYRNQLLTFGSKRAIYMGADGSQQTGIIQAADGNTYYADPKTGNVQRNLGEFRLNGRTYHSGNGYALSRGFIVNRYFGPHRLENTTATINGRTYRFDANGRASLVNTYSVPGEWSYSGGYLSGPAITDRHVGNNFAVVSLRHQYMWVFHNGKLAVETPIISGKPVSPTLRGNFNVQYMEKGRYLTGPGYKSWVDYWVPFSGAYGIHDAPWQRYNRFYKDSKSYTWAGSHGCVNVMPSVMPRVYAALYRGSSVTVY